MTCYLLRYFFVVLLFFDIFHCKGLYCVARLKKDRNKFEIMSEDIDPLLYVFARPIGSIGQYAPITLEHADTFPIHKSELTDFVVDLKEKGFECVYYSIERLHLDLAQLLRKTFGVHETVEALPEAVFSQPISWEELAKRG